MKILLAFGLVCFLVPGTVQDPCKDYITDTQEKRRLGYAADEDTEQYISDIDLVEEGKWYRFQVHYPSKMANDCVRGLTCGTERPVWMKGRHPTALDPGPKEVGVCSEKQADCCGDWFSNILVKFCRVINKEGIDDDFYVYQLKKPPDRQMAYCIVDATVCPQSTVFIRDSYACEPIGAQEKSTESIGQRASAYSYGVVVAILGSMALRCNFC